MDLIILTDGVYHLVEVTKQMTAGIELFDEIDCFSLCDIIRLRLKEYSETLNLYNMNNGSGYFYGCMCR